MTKIPLTTDDLSIYFVLNWFEDQKEALRDFKNKNFDAVINGIGLPNPKFITFTLQELNNYFNLSEQELETLACFSLVSITEGVLKLDYFTRVYNKDKSNLGRLFRAIYKEKQEKVSLEEDIIDNWKAEAPADKRAFSDLLGLLHYRHWLAHGRYWTINSRGRKYGIVETFQISDRVILVVSNYA